MPERGENLERLTAEIAMNDNYNRMLLYTPPGTFPDRGDKSVLIQAIFENDYQEVNGESVDISSRTPAAIVLTRDIPDIDEGAIIEEGDSYENKYYVKNFQPDESLEDGLTLLLLEAQQ